MYSRNISHDDWLELGFCIGSIANIITLTDEVRDASVDERDEECVGALLEAISAIAKITKTRLDTVLDNIDSEHAARINEQARSR